MATDHLSTTFAALADPTRRAILSRLSTGEANVSDLAKPFRMSLPAVSRHLKVLKTAGLISRGRDAQWRPCRLETAPLREVADFVEQYRALWDERFDRLDAYLRELQAQEHGRKVDGTHVKPHGSESKASRRKRTSSRTSRRRGKT